MKYNININQKALIQLVGEDFDLIDAAILDFLIDFCSSDNKKIEKMSYKENGTEYYYTWVNQELINNQVPLLRFKQTDSISRRIQKIKKYGFIKTFTVRAPESGQLRTYIRLTEYIDLIKFDRNITNKVENEDLSVQTDSPISLNLKPFQSTLKDNNINNNNIINNIYTYYTQKIYKTSKLTDEGKKKIITRLKSYSEEELLRAIDKFSSNSWWMERNSNQGIVWFFRSDDQVDRFLNLKEETKAQTFVFKA